MLWFDGASVATIRVIMCVVPPPSQVRRKQLVLQQQCATIGGNDNHILIEYHISRRTNPTGVRRL